MAEIKRKTGRRIYAVRVKTREDLETDAAIGRRILEVRTDIAKLDQRKFAAKLGVTSPAVAQWELGKGCTRANLDRIVAEYGVGRDWLHTGFGPRQPSGIARDMTLLSPENNLVLQAYVRFLLLQQNGGFADDQTLEKIESDNNDAAHTRQSRRHGGNRNP